MSAATVRFTVFGIEVWRLNADIDTPAAPRPGGVIDAGRGLALRLAKWVIR